MRKEITKDLEAAGHVVKIEDYLNKVGFSERTDAVIEPKLSMQWFMRMAEMAKPALDVVEDDTVNFVPRKFKKTPTVIGWKTFGTGASRASCGGANASRFTTCPMMNLWWQNRSKTP